jgi:hypothetical protein
MIRAYAIDVHPLNMAISSPFLLRRLRARSGNSGLNGAESGIDPNGTSALACQSPCQRNQRPFRMGSAKDDVIEPLA